MKMFAARIGSVTPSNYAAPPLAAFEAWREAYVRAHPSVETTLPSASILRRMVQLRRAGDTFSEIGRCCGRRVNWAKRAYARLPEDLRGSGRLAED